MQLEQCYVSTKYELIDPHVSEILSTSSNYIKMHQIQMWVNVFLWLYQWVGKNKQKYMDNSSQIAGGVNDIYYSWFFPTLK